MSLNRTTCPSCGAGLKSAAGFNPGQAVRCPKCATPFTIPDADAGFEEVDDDAPPPKKKAPPARAARSARDDDDDRPRRRPRDDDDDDDRPRKKGKKKKGDGGYKTSPLRFAVLGVLLVILGVLAFLLYQKRMREKEEAEGPAPQEGGNQQLAPPIRRGTPGPGPGPGPVGDGAVAGGPKAEDFRPTGNGPDADAVKRGRGDLKRVMIALHNHSDVNNKFPHAAITAPDGKALLSWRVALLPYLEQGELYKQFKLNEPWDSPANRPLLAQMPDVFRGTLPGNDGKTAFRVFVGGGAVFDLRQGRPVQRITDGSSNTLAVVEAGPPVEWTKPDDIPFDGRTAPRLVPPTGGNTILAALADGRVLTLNVATTPPDVLRRLIGADDGEIVEVP